MKNIYLPFTILVTSFFFLMHQNLQAQTRLSDSTALVALYTNNGGTGWTNSTNWLTTQPIDTWYGVHVSGSGRVDSVTLPGNKLINSFPNTVNTISTLAKFDVSHNNLTGSMGYLSCDSLQILNVSFNQIGGSIYFYDLPNLAIFRINNNNFSGVAGGGFPKAKEINESHNNFTGTLPYWGTNVFDSIDVSYNQLSGSVDFFIYPNCAYYNVSHNQLSGSWGYFNGQTATAVLDVSHNKFTFNELEPVISSLAPGCTYAPQDTLLPAHFTNGKLSVLAGGTLSNNTYAWYKANVLQATVPGDSTYTPPTAGTYLVNVTNSVATALTLQSNTVTISLFNATAVVTPASSCGTGNNASIQVYLTGGTAPYTYVLTKPGGGTATQTKGYFASLGTGTYSVTVTDKNNNTATAGGVLVTQAAAITPKIVINPASGCTSVSNGSIQAGANGGTAPFHYMLTLPDNSTVAQKSPLFNSLAAGTYSLTAIDTTGCTGTLANVVVPHAAPIAVTPVISPASNCGSGSDGGIKAANTGGMAPFHYLLIKPDNSTVAQQSPVFSNLSPGAYSVTITDSSGCTGTLAGIAVTTAAPITVIPLVTKTSSCRAGSDGSISAGRTGGVSPFHYLLTKPDNSTVAQRNLVFGGLAAGTYSLTITDTAGCTGTLAGIIITQAAAPTPKYAVTPASSCGSGSNGSIAAGASGGIAPYHYVLTLPDNSTVAQKSPVFGNLLPGTYSLTAIDTAGCQTTQAGIAVVKAAPIGITTVITPLPGCAYNNNERLTVKATGGIMPYTYSLGQTYNNIPFDIQASGIFDHIEEGVLNIFVTDHSGCADTAFNVNIPNGPHPHFINASKTDPSCITASDGIITTGITGGTAPYTIYLENKDYGVIAYANNSSATFPGLPAGDYHLTAADANTCGTPYYDFTLSSTVACVPPAAAPAITQGSDGAVAKLAGGLAVRVLPNPTTTVFVLAVTSAKNYAVEITVTDMYGRAVHRARGAANRQYSFGATFAAGMYMARVMQGNEVVVVKMIKQ